MKRIGIFPGSFDPFTIGHADIVNRALPLLDLLVIGVGVNERKQNMYSATQRVEAIARLYDGEPKIKVLAYQNDTIELSHRWGAL